MQVQYHHVQEPFEALEHKMQSGCTFGHASDIQITMIEQMISYIQQHLVQSLTLTLVVS